ncbi:hypothetical protein [Ramlibacter sp. 2FC]|uniref:hypothetical protein n=1 Tax=Ramlibacter sp. 2FC TaxID=2502188 RepID=UPI0010F5CE1A|nr:hypothetical protein [Ramlibacter sp. 2FC]
MSPIGKIRKLGIPASTLAACVGLSVSLHGGVSAQTLKTGVIAPLADSGTPSGIAAADSRRMQ